VPTGKLDPKGKVEGGVREGHPKNPPGRGGSSKGKWAGKITILKSRVTTREKKALGDRRNGKRDFRREATSHISWGCRHREKSILWRHEMFREMRMEYDALRVVL